MLGNLESPRDEGVEAKGEVYETQCRKDGYRVGRMEDVQKRK